MNMMKAAVMPRYNQMEVREVPKPDAAPGELRVAVQAVGICGSDVHGYTGASGRRDPGQFGIWMGHEFAGVVESIGEGVEGFSLGDRVVLDSTVYCGQCRPCLRGETNQCISAQVFGAAPEGANWRRMGAMAEFVVGPARLAYKLPDAVSFDHAALVEPLSVGLYATMLAQAEADSNVLVIGAGMIGQAVIAQTPGHVYAINRGRRRRDAAEKLGAQIVETTEDMVGQFRSMTGGGADIVYECVGTQATVDWAEQMVRNGGRVVLLGNTDKSAGFPVQKAVTRGLTVMGSRAFIGPECYPTVIAAIADGKIPGDNFISQRVSLPDAPAWFANLAAGGDETKVIINPAA
jgi:L-iditol 2-dehydrogenase